MRSMTGFGSGYADEEESGIRFKTELTSVNKKQYELKTVLHHDLTPFEIPLRMKVAEKVQRGSVTLRMELIHTKTLPASDIDFSRALSVFRAASEFSRLNGIPGTLTISDLLQIPDCAVMKGTDLSGEKLQKAMYASLDAALASFIAMRDHEGTVLSGEILGRIDGMEQAVISVEPMVKELPRRQVERLMERLKEMNIPADPSDERFLKECVIFADKLDVTEELTRLHCHFSHFRKLAAEEGAVGRSLDFLVQEIFREINTLGTKAASSQVSPVTVFLKNELEKIREQVQNIE